MALLQWYYADPKLFNPLYTTSKTLKVLNY